MKKMKMLVIVLASLLLVLSACSWNSSDDEETVKIATMTTTESNIMGNMIKLMIEHYTDEDVEMINNLGSSVVLHQAMVNDDANISAVRYTGTDLTGALKEKPLKDPEQAMALVQKLFQERFDQTFFDSYGFANTYAFMVTKETAKKYNLKKVSDLKNIAKNLQAGVDSSWVNRAGDGYKDFVKAYGFDFKDVYPMQIGLVYDALAANKMDIVLGYTTDGRIASYDLVVLEDDLHFFPPYDASPLAVNQLLEEKPQVKKAIEKLIGKISTEQMQKLNYEADNNLIEPAIVAKRFLEKNNYFEDQKEE
ncbi:osmoprotectant ABC transporter substrate-binding protein [Rummeliibacillus suwonensis]|uniref:osmoprotectant ABC transporter substrate-binding protein n=1 Tax=Rummeliibacillus suwonensis TaxID=1306154 RepID=UPI001AAF5958|nr:osmoprotectant ABC transporter substrate-binding protein [Rummeliibacillus suwonensis]MBO2535702.1 osmoprotectant ABC transporter substrate-binding protein [Rummeliibacillus suwonensis]